jgi:hypothetical protein
MAVPPTQEICLGATMLYTLSSRQHCSFLHGVEMVHVPFLIAHDDIVFLHHILEVCHYFIPVGSCIPSVFDLVQFLYTTYADGLSSYAKKLFVGKLLTAIGLYPQDKKFQRSSIYALLGIPLRDIQGKKAHDEQEEMELEQWLKSCLAIHPLMNKFNTLCFLDSGRKI